MRFTSMRSQSWLAVSAGLLAIVVLSRSTRASYDYSVAVAPSSQMFGDTTVSLTGNSFGGLAGVNTVNLASLRVDTPTQQPAVDTIDLPYTLQVTITDPSFPGQMAVFQIGGELTGTANSTRSDLQNTYTSVTPDSVTIGGTPFSIDVGPVGIPNIFFTPPTVNGVDGALGARILPEPTGLSLLILAAACLLLRRPRRKTA